MAHAHHDAAAVKNESESEIQAQLCAYNNAFEDLDLKFRWDTHTLRALAASGSDHEKVARYIETQCPHLLTAYSAEFLCQAIVERKNANYHACRANTIRYEDSTQRARLWRSNSHEGRAAQA